MENGKRIFWPRYGRLSEVDNDIQQPESLYSMSSMTEYKHHSTTCFPSPYAELDENENHSSCTMALRSVQGLSRMARSKVAVQENRTLKIRKSKRVKGRGDSRSALGERVSFFNSPVENDDEPLLNWYANKKVGRFKAGDSNPRKCFPPESRLGIAPFPLVCPPTGGGCPPPAAMLGLTTRDESYIVFSKE